MSRIEDLWEGLFNEPIDALSLQVMQGVREHLGEDGTVEILIAILLYVQVKVLLKDPASPFRIASRLGNAMLELEAALERLNQNSVLMQERIQGLNRKLSLGDTLVRRAGDLLDELRNRPPRKFTVNVDPIEREYTYALADEAMEEFRGMILKTCATACLVSSALTVTIMTFVL